MALLCHGQKPWSVSGIPKILKNRVSSVREKRQTIRASDRSADGLSLYITEYRRKCSVYSHSIVAGGFEEMS